MYIGHSETENYLQPTPAVPPHTMHRNNEKRTGPHVSEAPARAPQPANPVQEKMRQILQDKQGDVYSGVYFNFIMSKDVPFSCYTT